MSKKGGADGGEDPANAVGSVSGTNASVEAVDECGLASPTVPRTARAKSPRGALRLLEADEMLICVFMIWWRSIVRKLPEKFFRFPWRRTRGHVGLKPHLSVCLLPGPLN